MDAVFNGWVAAVFALCVFFVLVVVVVFVFFFFFLFIIIFVLVVYPSLDASGSREAV